MRSFRPLFVDFNECVTRRVFYTVVKVVAKFPGVSHLVVFLMLGLSSVDASFIAQRPTKAVSSPL